MSFQPAEDLLPELLLSDAPIMNFLDVLNLIRQFVLSTFFNVRIETFFKGHRTTCHLQTMESITKKSIKSTPRPRHRWQRYRLIRQRWA